MNAGDEDDHLAASSRRGEPRALALLYAKHGPALLRFLRARGSSRDDAEDILQETFVRLLEGRGHYEARGSFRAWLFTIAVRLEIDRARRRTRQAEIATRQADAASHEAAVDVLETVARSHLLARVEGVLATLSPEMRTAFQLRVRERFSYAEIAAICGDPEGTWRSRVHHAIRRLQAALQGEAADSSTPRQANEACAEDERL